MIASTVGREGMLRPEVTPPKTMSVVCRRRERTNDHAAVRIAEVVASEGLVEMSTGDDLKSPLSVSWVEVSNDDKEEPTRRSFQYVRDLFCREGSKVAEM